MKSKLCLACAAVLAAAAAPAWALQLGQIQVKSALNQPLVAAILLHPDNLTELEGLTVGLAPAQDFQRAGLQLTSTDQTLRFHVVTDNNGQKLILVTSSQPITDPYLDFLVQVNTRRGKQVREFVVLLNPVIAAPAPEVQAAPAASAPATGAPPVSQPAELPPSSAFVQPQPSPAQQPTQPAPSAPLPAESAPLPAPVAAHGKLGPVAHGDTLYHIASQAVQGTGVSVNQMMLALLAANPQAFYRHNIDALKAGAILRIPTRDEIDQRSLAAADAEVRRQYASWRATKANAATVVAGNAAEAAARSAPAPRNGKPAADHLALVPPTGPGGGASRAGVAGGTGNETVAGLQQRLQNDRSSLISLKQSNADLESRVLSLKDIADKSDKLLSLKDATVAELQRKLAALPANKAGAARAGTSAVAKTAAPAAASARGTARPATASSAAQTPWYERPLAWIVAALVLLVLIFVGLLRRRREPEESAPVRGPLHDPEDVAPAGTAAMDDDEAALRAALDAHPADLAAHLALCRLCYARGDTARFVAAAEAMRANVTDPGCVEWREVLVMGQELAPQQPLFGARVSKDPYGLEALRQPVAAAAPIVATPPAMPKPATPGAWPAVPKEQPVEVEPLQGDSADTKLDLARAYLDMGDPVGARAMLEEVLREGSQTQKDEARRLLAETPG